MKLASLEPNRDPRDSARKVFEIEGTALLDFACNLPDDFTPAVELILANSGRVIVSGMGKSGHIGRKIAATLASTGTPAFFVHPAEASHGDLGMVTKSDICLLISNSGETTELHDLIAHCTRFSIPMIGISRQADSTLMRAARLRLIMPEAPEACLIGLAPTTSTTLTLALGDALAVALMEQRGFLPEHFSTYHPGGKLGARLATVAQLMHGNDALPIVRAQTSMQETVLVMTARGFGIACVLDNENRLIGVISDGDLRRKMEHLLDLTAGDVCSRDPVCVAPETLAAEALAIMNERKISALFVTTEQRPVGILHIHDCLRAGVS